MKTVAAGKSGASSPGRLGWEARLAIGLVRLGDVNALAVGGTSRLAENLSFSMQAGSHLFVVRVVLLDPLTAWCSGCPSLILCRLAGRDPMQLGAAMLLANWLDGRSLG
jgi:hypothetical protein